MPHDDENKNIFADDDALEFIIYEDIEKQDQERKDGKGGCLGIVALMLLPVSMVLLTRKC